VKHLFRKLLVVCILFIPAVATAAIIGPARVSLVSGDILFRTADTDEWLAAAINTPIDEGDELWCPAGAKAELQLPDGSMVRLADGSQLSFLANEDGFAHLYLASGKLYLKTSKSIDNNAIQIDADDTTILPTAQTRLSISLLPDGLEEVAIFKGSAYVEGNGNRTRVRAGEQIELADEQSDILPLADPDDWEQWNMARDREQSRRAGSVTYLPDELTAYSAELAANGTWVRVPDYGMVWRPTVIVSDDWAPYRSGRWVWKGNDYIWISYEHWGWIPYHYGRWAYVGGFWCWVPPQRGDVYWGPGYVGWYRTGNHVGWTPLAPGEIFYGYGNYGRLSINLSKTAAPATKIRYRNREVRGGLTVLPHNDFLKGRSGNRQPRRNITVIVAETAGSPRIKPMRETRMPLIKNIPVRDIPPRSEQRNYRNLRQRFPRLVPGADMQHRQQQSTPGTTAPHVPSGKESQEERAISPATSQPQARPEPVKQPPTAIRQQGDNRPRTAEPQRQRQSAPAATGVTRDENKQKTTYPPASAQPSPSTAPIAAPQQPANHQETKPRLRQQPIPAAPAATTPSAQERGKHPETEPRIKPQPVPAASAPPGQGREKRPERAPQIQPQPAPTATGSPAQKSDQSRRVGIPGEMKEKKVWKVITNENGKNSEQKEPENRENSRKGK
jgi:hypothetical protein